MGIFSGEPPTLCDKCHVIFNNEHKDYFSDSTASPGFKITSRGKTAHYRPTNTTSSSHSVFPGGLTSKYKQSPHLLSFSHSAETQYFLVWLLANSANNLQQYYKHKESTDTREISQICTVFVKFVVLQLLLYTVISDAAVTCVFRQLKHLVRRRVKRCPALYKYQIIKKR